MMSEGGNGDPRQQPGRSPGKLPRSLIAYRIVLWIVPYPIVISLAGGSMMLAHRYAGWSSLLGFVGFLSSLGATFAIGWLDGRITRDFRLLAWPLWLHAVEFIFIQIFIGLLISVGTGAFINY